MKFKIDHIGYLTGDIEQTSKEFCRLGYEAGGVILDNVQKTKICFLSRENEVRIELVEPYKDNKTMWKTLQKYGSTSPYHVCYEVDNILTVHEQMINEGWFELFEPVEAPALGNRRICYYWKDVIGFIELVNKY